MKETRGLGRGLSSLIGEAPARTPRDGLRKIPVGELKPNPKQPRTHFDEDELASLADSIRRHGLVQPLVARPAKNGDGFEIVAGERRWRAAQKARVHEVPVLVRELDDRQVLEIALIENLQRSDLGALEEAHAFDRLNKEFGLSHGQIAEAVGKSRSHVANTLRLLQLTDEVRRLLAAGEISVGHARAVLTLPDPDPIIAQVMSLGLSVRETEILVAGSGTARGKGGRGRRREPEAPDPDIRDLERRLGERTGLKVTVRRKGEGGELVLTYRNPEQLDDVIARLEAPTRPRLVQS